MSIEFHCEHCQKTIKAAASSAGKRGKCPFCQGEIYVPAIIEEADSGELPLAPLDDADEQKARRDALEAAALQRQLLADRETPPDPDAGRQKPAAPRRGDGPTPAAPAANAKQLNMLVVHYIEAMSSGQLDMAQAITRKLAQHAAQVRSILESIATGDCSGLGLPQLPRPVLLGFIKQLGSKL